MPAAALNPSTRPHRGNRRDDGPCPRARVNRHQPANRRPVWRRTHRRACRVAWSAACLCFRRDVDLQQHVTAVTGWTMAAKAMTSFSRSTDCTQRSAFRNRPVRCRWRSDPSGRRRAASWARLLHVFRRRRVAAAPAPRFPGLRSSTPREAPRLAGGAWLALSSIHMATRASWAGSWPLSATAEAYTATAPFLAAAWSRSGLKGSQCAPPAPRSSSFAGTRGRPGLDSKRRTGMSAPGGTTLRGRGERAPGE